MEELRNDAEFVKLKNNEFPEHLPLDEILNEKASKTETTPRRDFLKCRRFLAGRGLVTFTFGGLVLFLMQE